MVQVWHYDGTSAIRHQAELTPEGDGFALVFTSDTAAVHHIGWADLTARGTRGTATVFGHVRQPGWQIGFEGGVPTAIAAHLPQATRYGGWFDRYGVLKLGAAFAAVSAALIAVGLNAPDWIAPNIPLGYEQRIGTTMVGDLNGKFCNAKGGQAALDALVRRLNPAGPMPSVHVVHAAMVNAITLPGGTILVFDGLLRAANSPDELAGVLGHEIGHVHHRDVMQAMVRNAGLSVLLGGFGGNMGGTFNTLLSASYSRKAENAADDYAIGALRAAKLTPDDTAGLFDRLGKGEQGLGQAKLALAYLASHPVSADRAARFRKSARTGAAFTPALDRAQWGALVDICRNDPARRNDNAFDPFG